jgi:hypothetical protein
VGSRSASHPVNAGIICDTPDMAGQGESALDVTRSPRWQASKSRL